MEEFVEKQYDQRERFQQDPVSPTASTVYLQVKSEQVKGLLGSKYAVPAGFVAMVKDKAGKQKVLMPGEEAGGEFTAHLVRDRDVRLPFNQQIAGTKDGFEAVASFELSITPDVTRQDAIETFLERNVEGRRHVDWPVMKAEVQGEVAKAVKAVLADYSAAELNDANMETIRDRILQRCEAELASRGIAEASIELERIRSDGFEKHQQALNEVQLAGEKAKAQQDVQAAMLRDQMGQELSRNELESFLASAREEGLLKEHERQRAGLERKAELDKLEAEYRKQQHNLEATLRKMVMEDKLQLDTMMLDKHVDVVKKLKSELSDDRVEVYIHLIKDEKLKADLLHRLMLRSMTPEQLSALAAIEAQRTRQAELSISNPKLEPIRDEAGPTDTDKVRESDSVRIAAPVDSTVRRETHVEERDVAEEASLAMNAALGSALTEAVKEAEYKPDELVRDYNKQTGRLTIEAVEKARQKPAEDADTEEIDDNATEVLREQAEKQPQKQGEAGAEISALALVTCGRMVYAVDPLSQTSLENTVVAMDYQDGHLGSLRSVRVGGDPDNPLILAGARNGVYTTLLKHRKGNREYPIGTGVDARTGINAAVVFKGYIYATHSEFGMMRWPALQPYSSAIQVMPELISKYSTTRNLQIFDNRLLFANGPTVMLLESTNDNGSQLRVAARYRGTRHEVTALAADDKYVLIADTAGDVYVWDPSSTQPPVLAFYAGTAISDLAASELPDGRRCLMVAIKRPVVPMLFRDGSNALEFTSPEPIRACDVMNGVVVGLSRDRMRIFAWRENRPDWPAWQFQFTEPVLDMRLVAPGMLPADESHKHASKRQPRAASQVHHSGVRKPPGY